MLSLYNIKPKFQNLLNPILDFLHRNSISANQITITSILLSIIIGFLFWKADINNYFYLILPIGLFARMALNALDGMMARLYNQQTSLGEALNEIGDVISDTVIFFPLLKFETQNIYLVIIFILLSIINEFSGVLGKAISGERRYEGPMGKSDRALVLGIYGLLHFFKVNLEPISVYLFSLLIILLLISTYTRIYISINTKNG